ncbi:hypothetical protein NHF45_12975 [Maricaulaceae bacterium NA33B04]|nr:hypothetical protein [Maricaulaceae bacterium NA33B04]
MTPKLLITAAIASLLGTTALAAPIAPTETEALGVPEAPAVQLSSLEIEAALSASNLSALLAARSEVPQNCTVVGDPCSYIICGTPTQPGDWPRGLYACEPD